MTAGRAVLRGLHEEWSVLQEDPGAREACRRWSSGFAPLAGCGRPEEVRQRVADAPDPVLGRLLGAAAAGDPVAGRVVLQALLPKVVRMAATDPAAEVGDYVTAMWCTIAAYPLGRRPTSVAANLALDTLKAVQRDRRPAVDLATAPHLVVLAADHHPGRVVGRDPARPGPSAVAVLERARERRLLDPVTHALLHSVYAEGVSGEDAARRHGLSPGAVRSRCSRAVKVMAAHAEVLRTDAEPQAAIA